MNQLVSNKDDRSFWSKMMGGRGAVGRGKPIGGYERYAELPVVEEGPVDPQLRTAQHEFACTYNVGDLEALELLLATWEADGAASATGRRFADVAGHMVWNYAAPEGFETERCGARRCSMEEYILSLEKAADMHSDSAHFAALLANSYMEAASHYHLIERCAADGTYRSQIAYDLAEQVLDKHNPTRTENRMVAAASYRLQGLCKGNCEAFSAAFERLLDIDPSDLGVYRQHGADLVVHCGDDYDRLERSVQYCLYVDQTKVGLAGYFLFISNALAHSNEPLELVNTEMFEQGLSDLLRQTDDPQRELNELAHNMCKMTRRVSSSRTIGAAHRKVSDALRAVTCNRLNADMTMLRLDVWDMPQEAVVAQIEKLHQG